MNRDYYSHYVLPQVMQVASSREAVIEDSLTKAFKGSLPHSLSTTYDICPLQKTVIKICRSTLEEDDEWISFQLMQQVMPTATMAICKLQNIDKLAQSLLPSKKRQLSPVILKELKKQSETFNFYNNDFIQLFFSNSDALFPIELSFQQFLNVYLDKNFYLSRASVQLLSVNIEGSKFLDHSHSVYKVRDAIEHYHTAQTIDAYSCLLKNTSTNPALEDFSFRVSNVIAKPLKPLIFLADLDSHFLQDILKKSDQTHIQHQVFLSYLYQYLDLSHINIAFCPDVTLDSSEYPFLTAHYLNVVTNQTFSFSKLFAAYCHNSIDLRDIYITKHESLDAAYKVQTQDEVDQDFQILIHLFEKMKSASKWQLELFDNEMMGAESSLRSSYFVAKHPRTRPRENFIYDEYISLVPLRTDFLMQSSFALPTFSDSFIESLRSLLQANDTWSKKHYSFIWQNIKKDKHSLLEALLHPILLNKKYSLSYYRQIELALPLRQIASIFAKDLSDLSLHAKFWEELQNLLLSYDQTLNSGWFKLHTVDRSETIDLIAARYDLTPQILYDLNPGINESNLKPGFKLNVRPDLTSVCHVAQKHRLKMALALFPNENYLNSTTRNERIIRTTHYLNTYHTLKNLQDENDLQIALNIVNDSISPFSFITKKRLLKECNSPLLSIKEKMATILKAYTPNHLRMAYVMYPLMADAHQLYCYANNFTGDAESVEALNYNQTGNYLHSIESKLNIAFDLHQSDDSIIEFLVYFKKKLQDTKESEDSHFYVHTAL